MKNAFIDNLVREWSWRINDGMPDLKNRSHVMVLEAVLRQYKYSEQFIYEYINQLTEDKEFKARSTTGNKQIVAYASKENMEKAIEDGRAEPLDAKKAGPGKKEKVKGADLFKTKKTDKIKDKKDSDTQPKREISGKDKTLSKGNPAETDEFNKELDTSPTGDEDFAKKNKKNAIPPPYKLPESITKNPKFPKRYPKAIERMMNTRLNKETKKWSYFSDIDGGQGQISAQGGELLTMMGSSMTDEEFEEFISSLEKQEKEQIKNNPELKGEEYRIITSSWIKAARNSRKVILDRIKKKYGEDAEIAGSSWDVEDEVEAMGLSDYKNNKGFSTDMYLKIRKSDGEEILDEVSLKKDKHVNFLNSGLGHMIYNWDPELKGTSIDPKEYSKNERERLVKGAKNILPSKVQKELEAEIEATGTGMGSRDKSKAISKAIKEQAANGNQDAIKYLEEDDKIHRKMQVNAIDQLNTNPKVREGLIKNIKEEFPLKAVSEGEETMAIGDMSLDKETMKVIFGTDDFEELKENLSVKKTEKGKPYLVYEIEGKESVKVANIVIRQDGRGYGGGTIKFEMTLHPDLAKRLDSATKEVYK